MFGLGGGELLLLGIIALVFIGPKKLPELARGLGKGIREFQKAKNELLNEEDSDDLTESKKVIRIFIIGNRTTGRFFYLHIKS
jgi:TatA/E family protein of Tat protein translocase